MIAPSMADWETAWELSDAAALGNCYAETAVVMHPTLPLVSGRTEIIEFLKGGFESVDVNFHPIRVDMSGEMAFEHGTYNDLAIGSGEIVATGQYAITWTKADGEWRIQCHAWNDLT